MQLFKKCILLIPFILSLMSCGGGNGTSNPVANNTNNNDNNEISLDTLEKVDLDAKNISKFVETTRQFINDSVDSLQSTLHEYGNAMPIFSIPDSTNTFRCDLEGSVNQTITQSGAIVTQKYNNCGFHDNTVLDGSVSYIFSNIDRNNNSYTFSFTIENLTTTFQGKKEIINSSFETNVVVNNQSELSLINATINQQIVYPDRNEAYIAKDFQFSGSLDYRQTNSISLNTINGTVALQSLGIAALSFEQDNNRIVFKGIDEAIGYLTISDDIFSEKSIQLEFIDVNNKSMGSYVREAEINTWNILTGKNTPPTINEFINSNRDYEIDQNEILTLDFTDKVKDSNFDALNFDLIIKNASTPNNYTLAKTSFSKFTFTGTISKLYELELVVTDPYGLKANKVLNIRVNGDTDGDGILDKWDDDDDNDGVSDRLDAFPLNPQESADYDSDGVGDNADTDDDNDGTEDTLDFFPYNSVCTTHENGEPCYLSKVSSSIKINADSQGIIYFLDSEDKLIYRWSSLKQHFLKALDIGSVAPSDNKITQMTYSQSHERLYLGYDSGLVSYVDITTGLEHNFYTLPREVGGIASVGKYMLIQDQLYGNSDHYIFNSEGTLIDKEAYSSSSRVYEWNAAQNRVYFFRDGLSPNDLHYEEIDPDSGTFISNGESPYHGDYPIQPPIIISPKGDLIVIGSGNIFNTADLTWGGAIPGDIEDGLWLDSIGFVVLRSSGDNTLLERRNDNLLVLEKITFNGKPRKIISTPNGYYILSEQDNSLLITPYTPSDDTDGDGISNTTDHFPLDKAASVDSDNDGYPDYWNTGLTENDSTTGLTLDSYPQDSACYLPEHGDGVVCDVSSTLPDYTPNQTVLGADGIIYLFSKENNKVFRWSISANDDLSPIIVGDNSTFNNITFITTSPNLIAYSENHNRLYLGYENGKVTYISLSDSRLKEQDFTKVAQSVRGLASAGDFLLVQDNSGAWATHYYYDIEGTLTDSNDWNYFSTVYAWNANLNRIYFFRDDTFPNDLHYEEIDSVTGKRLAEGETPYHGDYPITAPLLISPNNNQVLIGSGNIFSSNSLEWRAAIVNTFNAGIWAKNGEIITLRVVSDITRLDHYDSNGSWVREQDYPGIPVGLFEYQNQYYVATKTSGRVLVSEYIAPN